MTLAMASAVLTIAAFPLTRWLGPRAGWVLGAGLAALTALLAGLWSVDGVTEQSVPWIPTFDVELALRLDGLGLLFGLLVLGIGAVILLYSATYLTEARPVSFYVLMVGFAASMLVLVLADDLIVMIVAWELTTLCSYGLVLRSGPNAVKPANRTLLVTAGGGLCLVAAAATIIVVTGTTRLSEALADPAWSDQPVFAGVTAALVAIAALTKAAQFPFHAWLPDAMVAPAPVSAYLHAAAMVKAGIFLLMRFADAASHSPVWGATLIGAGLLTAVMGAVFALQRTDLKELLAYSTVSQLGLLTAVIGVGGDVALRAAAVHVVAHALFKSAAFMHIGLLERRTGTRDIRELSGIGRLMPWSAGMIVLAAASMAGVPLLIGFVSKETMFEAFLTHDGGAILLAAAALASVGTVAYSARLVVNVLPGRPMRLQDTSRLGSMVTAISISAVPGLALGLAPGILDRIVNPATAATVPGSEPYALSIWHGINVPLIASLCVFAAGGALIVARSRVDAVLEQRRLFPITGVDAVEAIQAATIDWGRKVGDLTRYDLPARHLAIPAGLLAAAGVISAGLVSYDSPRADVRMADLALLITTILGICAILSASTRLGAVISVGIVGFTVALWFFLLGAADVALTQLLVETLTVVIIVLILRRLPARFAPRRRGQRVTTAVIAGAAGVAATVATLAWTGSRDLSPAGDYFLTEAETDTGGTNVVNTILVDYRALDTLGELVVLAIAALAMAALLQARTPVPIPGPPPLRTNVLENPLDNAVFLATLARVLVPLMLIGSAYALFRGHNAPGGGFIGALVGASALALLVLSGSSDDQPKLRRLPYLAIAGAGIVVAAGVGLLGLFDDSYLRPLHAYLFDIHLTTALVFDIGVYLAVFGVILAALKLLGIPTGGPTPDTRPRTEVDA